MAGALLEGALVPIELADSAHEVPPMAVFRGALGGLGVAALEPGPDALIIAVGETLRQIVRLLIEPGEESPDRLLGTFTHGTNDGLRQVNKQAWPRTH